MKQTIEEAASICAFETLSHLHGSVGCIPQCDEREWDLQRELIVGSFEKGATFALSSQWTRVEDGLPEEDYDVVTSDENGLHLANYFNGEWYSSDDEFTRSPQMWLRIPALPDGKEGEV